MNMTMAGLRDVIRRAITKERVITPAFQVYHSAGAANVTGDSTAYTIVYGTEVYDNGGDFASNTFTAPVSGRYLLIANISAQGFTSSHNYTQININTSNANFQGLSDGYIVTTATGVYRESFSVIANMDVGDTAIVTLTVVGGAKVIDLQNTLLSNNFQGVLLA